MKNIAFGKDLNRMAWRAEYGRVFSDGLDGIGQFSLGFSYTLQNLKHQK